MNQTVKILALSDVHGDIDKVDIGDAEIVIVAGDIGPDPTTQQKLHHMHKHEVSIKWAKSEKTIAWFKKHKDVRFYILPGNHDKFASHSDSRHEIKKLWPENVKLIKDAGYVDESGLTIWGMPWNPLKKNGRGTFGAKEEKIQRKCMKIVRHFKCLDILVTHAPPKIADSEYDKGGWHISGELAEMLPVIKPRLLICGHDHHLSHVPLRDKKTGTTIVNVAMKTEHALIDDGGTFVYKPRRIVATIERKIDFDMNMKDNMLVKD